MGSGGRTVIVIPVFFWPFLPALFLRRLLGVFLPVLEVPPRLGVVVALDLVTSGEWLSDGGWLALRRGEFTWSPEVAVVAGRSSKASFGSSADSGGFSTSK